MAEKELDKFIVVLKEDVDRYLDDIDRELLEDFLMEIAHGRHEDGRSQPHYIVCNQDEKYADEIWKTILKGETEKENA